MSTHARDCECHWCFEARHGAEHPERVDGCLACKFSGTIQLSPKATPSRTPGGPPAEQHNSWEKGIARDERGMPFLGKGGQPIGVKQYADGRSDIEAWRRRLKNDPTVFAETRS